MIHFRWASVGGVQPQLCHPFPVDRVSSTKLEGKAARPLFHNGTWSGHKSALEFVEAKQKRKVGGPMSDSRVIATRQATAARNLALRRVWRDGYIQRD